jgi:hypothetical protein
MYYSKINYENKDNWDKNNVITKKSTLFDYIEREKVIKRVT